MSFLVTGFRIGKGEGFADLEYAMMAAMGAVNENTVVVTTVHESQIMDIPEELLGDHDLTVDYIVTEEEIIECNSGRPKPAGIIWSMLDKEKLNRVPILKRLRKMESDAGKDVTIKDSAEVDPIDSAEEENDDADNRPRSGRGRRGRRGGRGAYGNQRPYRNGPGEGYPGRGRGGRRRGRGRGGLRDGPGRRQYEDDIPSVYVGGIPGSVRVSELKSKIREKEVNPLRVIWHGQNGHAFLQFQEATAADEAIEALKDLEIVGKPLRVEHSRRSKPSGDMNTSGEGHDIDQRNKGEESGNTRTESDGEANAKGDAGPDADVDVD